MTNETQVCCSCKRDTLPENIIEISFDLFCSECIGAELKEILDEMAKIEEHELE